MDAQTAREVLTSYLKADGKQRLTPERYAILDTVMGIQGHFDAESLYYRLMANGVKISKATVYNTLDILLNAGLVSKYRFADKTSRYEKAFGRPHHHHLICLQCGEIVEFVDEKLDSRPMYARRKTLLHRVRLFRFLALVPNAKRKNDVYEIIRQPS